MRERERERVFFSFFHADGAINQLLGFSGGDCEMHGFTPCSNQFVYNGLMFVDLFSKHRNLHPFAQ